MAYVLGVVYTDGNLNPGRIREPWRSKSTNTVPAFTISQKERELLDKILFLMECDAKLFFHKERQYGDIVSGALYEFRISNEKVYDDLVKLGLSPKKSLTLNFPQIPKEYIRHFIRGCWDGDGSVYIDKQSKCITASFVSGSLKFIEGLITALKDAGFPERMIYINKRKNPSYYIRVTGAQVVKLYHYLYDNVPPKQYLERKFNLFHISLEMNTKQSALSSSKS